MMYNRCDDCSDSSSYLLIQYLDLFESLGINELQDKQNEEIVEDLCTSIKLCIPSDFRCDFGLDLSTCRYSANYHQIDLYKHNIVEQMVILALNQDEKYLQALENMMYIDPILSEMIQEKISTVSA